MRHARIAVATVVGALLGGNCARGHEEIPLSPDQAYRVESSGRVLIYPPATRELAPGASPLHHLRVAKKNDTPVVRIAGCWTCTGCSCIDDECSCAQCTAC